MDGLVRVTLATPGTTHLRQLVELADRNSKYLGHFPASCFEREAARQRVLIAVGPDDRVWGHVLYRTTLDRAVVQQLCVDERHRRTGVAKALVDELKNRTRHLPSIICHCALEYADSIAAWERLGFVPMGEKVGRGQRRRPLMRLVYDHQHPTLFSSIEVSDAIVAVMDTNIVLAVIEERDDPGTAVLRADWLQEEVSLQVVDEVLTEVRRKEDAAERKRHMAQLRSIKSVPRNHAREALLMTALTESLGRPARVQDRSDYRQLAQAAAGGAPVFLTGDDGILSRRDQIQQVLGLKVMRPVEFIVSLDEVSNAGAYVPSALSGTTIDVRRPGAEELDHLVTQFLNHGRGEKRSQLAGTVHEAMLSQQSAAIQVVRSRDRVAALRAVHWDDDVSRLTLLRVSRDSLSETLTRHLLHDAVRSTARTGRALTVVEDVAPLVSLEQSAMACEFVRAGSCWVKWSRPGLHTRDGISADLERLTARYPQLASCLRNLAASIATLPDAQVERLIWPGLLVDSRLQSYVFPIQPRWAQHLFDVDLAARGVFGGDPALILNTENVYYRSPRGDFAPGSRIFWYVSQNHGDKVMQLRAMSSVIGTHRGPAKQLFTRFRRLGVYSWTDVLNAADGDPKGEVMAVHFGPTELLPKAVPGDQLRSIINHHRGRGKTPTLAGPETLTGDCVQSIFEAAYGG